jgi:hypothetical protein
MPDRATLEAATPRCQALIRVNALKPERDLICDKPLEWKQLHEAWACPTHGYSGHNAAVERMEANA